MPAVAAPVWGFVQSAKMPIAARWKRALSVLISSSEFNSPFVISPSSFMTVTSCRLAMKPAASSDAWTWFNVRMVLMFFLEEVQGHGAIRFAFDELLYFWI